MTPAPLSSQDVRAVLSPLGPLRPQPPTDWTGEGPLHPSLIRFYDEVGPLGEEGPYGFDGLIVPMLGNDLRLPPLRDLWASQEGYRWHGLTGERLADWRDSWLVVADQGGDAFVLDTNDGTILFAEHGLGEWTPEPMFADVFVMAWALGTIAAVHEAAGDTLYDDDFMVQPEWRAAVRAQLGERLGKQDAEAVAAQFGWVAF